MYSPILVTTNNVRKDFNSFCTETYAAKTNKKIYRCRAKIYSSITNKDLAYIRTLSETGTGKISMELDLVLGMPITTTANNSNRSLQIANGYGFMF
jgi:hypothetical protein